MRTMPVVRDWSSSKVRLTSFVAMMSLLPAGAYERTTAPESETVISFSH